MTSPNRPNEPSPPGVNGRLSTSFSWISTWQNLIKLFATADAPSNSTLVRLEALEERVLYNASPLLALAPDFGTAHEHQIDIQLDELSELCFEAVCDYPSMVSEDFSLDAHSFDDGFPLVTSLDEQQLEEYELNRQLIVIDVRIDGFEDLISDITLQGNKQIAYDVLTLDDSTSGIGRISRYLEMGQAYEAIHIVAHGGDDRVQLGNVELTSELLHKYKDEIAGWASGLASDADILFYGCEVAASEQGRLLVDQIGQFTGADIAASDDLTGSAELGGDWDFEYFFGTVEAELAFSLDVQANWTGLLNTESVSEQAVANYITVPLTFEQNDGQVDAEVDFLARGSGYTVFLSDGDAELSLSNGETDYAVRLHLEGSNSTAAVAGQDELASRTNYLVGDSSEWLTDVGNFGRVLYSDIYDGIDVAYYGNQRQLEYDFIVNPGASVGEIQLSFEGAHSLSIAAAGELVITLNAVGDEVRFQAPYSYQDTADGRQLVESKYVIHADGTVGFEVGDYDASQTLVIDPILDYSTVLGGTGNETAFRITEDGAGNVYVLGNTRSTDFPATTGSLSGSSDIYIAKLSPDGSGASDLVYATYIGGSGNEYGAGGIHVNGAGEVIFLGSTESADFATTAGAYDTSLGGSADAVIGKLNAAGNSLLYSTYYGGNAGSEAAGAMAVDSSGNVYITGQTLSNNLPTVNAYDASFTGSSDIYVAKFNLAGGGSSDLLYSTYLGGNTDYERSSGIDVDGAGKVYITGPAFSGHPTTAGAFQTTMEGSSDAFLTVLDTTVSGASGLVYSTFIGGTGSEQATDVYYRATDGYVYLAGRTSSTDFDTTTGAYMETSGGGWDGFLAIINPVSGGSSDLIYSTYLGGAGTDYVEGLDVDSSGIAYISGYTAGGMPLVNPTQGTFGGGSYDAFVATLNPAASGSGDLTFSTLLGGSGTEYGHDIVVDSAGNFYVTGYTASADFPTTSGAYDETANGGNDAFVAKYSAANVAPVLSGSNDLTTINEDDVTNSGTLVSALIAGHVTDVNGGDPSGIAVINVDNTNGSWEYSTNNGGIWNAFGSPSDATARLLSDDVNTLVRFVPNSDWNGTVTNGITFRAWDQTSGSNGGTADLTDSAATVLDQFSTVSYSNNDGTANWTSDWIEANDDGVAATGNIRVESNKLRVDNLDGGSFSSVTRSADLAAAPTATLTFDYDGIREGTVGGDRFTVEISNDGGATWTLLEEITAPGATTANSPFSGSASYALEGFVTLTNDMVVRLSISAGFGGTDQHVNFDNVQISSMTSATGGSTAYSTSSDGAAITVTAINDAPIASAIEGTNLAYTENDAATQITNTISISDIDDTNFESAVVQITGNYANGEDVLAFTDTGTITGVWNAVAGTMTVTGNDTLANYEAALRSITYENTSDDPSGLTRTVSLTVNDGDVDSNTLTRDIDVTPANDAPTHGAGNISAIWEDDTNPPGETVGNLFTPTFTDPDSGAALAGVAITSNAAPGTQGVWEYSTDGGTTWYAIGAASDAASVVFDTTTRLRFVPAADFNGGPTVLTSRVLDNTYAGAFTSGATIETISTSTNGGTTPISSTLRNVSSVVLPVNDNPVESTIEGTNVAYTENDSATQITNTIAIADVDDTNIESAVVQVTGNFVSGQDVLAFTDTGTITGVWNTVTGTMTLTGSDTLANYEAALRSVTYQNTSDDPSGLTRTVSFTVNDGNLNSNTLTRDIDVTPVNDASVESAIEGTNVAYTENDAATQITNTIAIADLDDTNIELAVVQITGNYANGQDVLAFTNTGTITGVWNAISGTITLTGSDTLANYEAALRTITYENTSDNLSNLTRTISFTVNDGDVDSNTLTRLIDVTQVNDAPINLMAMIPGQAATTSADGASSVATGDFDGDGDIDIVSASIIDNTFAWYENDGAASPGFAVNTITTSALGARFVSVADVDGDLDLDIVAASTDDDTIAWYDNDGAGNFTLRVVTATADGATSAYAADMDGDGDMDIVASSYIDDTIAWYENDGSENFTYNAIDIAADGAWMIHLVDMDGDLDMDVVAANWFDSEVAWYENDGAVNPVFAKQVVSSTISGASSVYAADVDGDGDIDFIATSFFNDTVSLFTNDGSEVFSESFLTNQADGARQAIMADVDSDGDEDIIVAASNSGEVLWFENDGAATPTFEQYTLSDGNAGPMAIAVDDLDNDGTPDVITAVFNDDAINVYENESGQLAAVTTNEDTPLVFNTANGNLISINDIDANNGMMSMAITVDIGTLTLSGTTGLLFTTGDGTADPVMVFTGTVADVNAALDGLVYNPPLDFNGDAKLTLITGDQGNTGGGALADSDSLKITVLPVNDEPVGFDNTVVTNEDTDYVFGTGDFSWADIEGDNLAAVQITTLPAVGTLYLDLNGDGLVGGGEAISASDVITMVDIDAGRLRFKPVANANGPGYTSFTFQVRDDGGTSNGGVDTDSTPNTMTIDVTPVNDEQLIATNTGITVLEGSSGNVVTTAMLETTDVDHTAAQLTYTITAVPISGFVKRLGVNLAVSSTFTQADIDTGFITYLHDGSETVADSYSFSVDDGTGSSSSGTFNITITPVNDNAPVFTTPSAVNVVENTTPVMTVNATDADQPGQTVTYTISGGLDSTLFSIDANTGDLTFNAPRDFETPGDSNGDNVYEVEVTADDNVSLTTAQTILITVTDDNDSPVITTTTFNSAENQTSIGTLLASDDDGDVPTYTITGGADQTDFNLTPAGVLTFNTAQDFENPTDADTDGVYEVQVTANDGNGGTDVRTILVTVTDANDAPVISTTTFNSAENQTSVGNLLASDDDGDVPTYTITGGADQTEFNLTPAGVLTFNTAQDFENPTDADTDGVYEVQVTANDGNGGTDVRTILITVTDDNDAPLITTSTFNAAENQTSIGNMLASDQDGDVPTYTITGGADQTDFNLTPAGVLTFNTAQDFENPTDADTNGVYEVQVTANDGNGGTDVRTILITVTDDNDAPLITTSTFNAAENQTSIGNMLASDQDGDVPTYTITGGADQTDFNLTPAGVLTFNTAQDFENPTDADTDGVYEVQVTANDGNGGTDVRTILVTVTDANDAPVISTTTFNAAENQTSVGTLLASDQDGDIPTYTITGGADQTDFNLTPAGVLTFNTAQDFENPIDANTDGVYEVQVTANDGNGGTDVRTILITVTGANEAPVITTTTFNAAENQSSVGTLLASDDDGDVPTYNITGGADQTDFNLTPAGVLTFNTAQDFENPTDANTDGVYEVQVTANDGNGGADVRTIMVTVTDGNDAPIITTSTFNAAENQTSVGNLLASDDDGDVSTYTITGGADQTDFNLTPAGVLTFNSAQDFENPTDADTDGVYGVQVTANDGNGGTDVRTILVTVTDDNDAPVITTSTFNAVENQISIGNMLASDQDGDIPTYTITGGADQTDFNLTPAGVLTFNTAQDFENPTDANTDGVYEVQVTANDGNGGTDVRTILVTVTDDNDAPLITTSTFNAAENQTSIGNMLASDQDGDVPTYTITGGADQTDFNLTPAGVLTFNTAQDFENPTDANTNGVYEVQVTANDGNGGTDVRTILVTITDGNDAPLITSDGGGTSASINVVENATAVTNVISNDPDLPPNTLTYAITGGADSADFAINSSTGELTFVSGKDFETPSDANLDGTYEVQITVDDGNGGTDIQTISVTVTDVNEAPVANPDSTTVVEGGTVNVMVPGVTANDTDDDADALSVSLVSGPTNGSLTLNPDGSFSYTHDGSETTVDSFVYQVADGNGGFDTQTVAITVTPVNDAPSANAEVYSIAEDTTLNSPFDVLANDTDAEADALTISLIDPPDHADFFVLNPSGSFNYVPSPEFNGVDTFTYQIDDGNGGVDSATVTITITPVNDTPVGSTDSYTTSVETTINAIVSVLSNDSDVEGDPLSAILLSGPVNGTLSLAPNGTFAYTPDAGFVGVDSFSYIPNDGMINGVATLVNIEVVVGTNKDIDIDKSKEPPDDEPKKEPESKTETKKTVEPDLADKLATDPLFDGAVLRLGTISDFDGGVDSLFQLLANRQQAEDVLNIMLQNVDADLLDEDDGKRRVDTGLSTAFDPKYLWHDLDSLNDLQRKLFEQMNISIGAVTAVSTLGYILWSLRGGVLIAAAITQMPNWRLIDPLPVLENYETKAGSSKGDELNSFFDRN